MKSNVCELNIPAEPIEDLSPTKISSYLEKEDDFSEDEGIPQHRIRKRIRQFSDSDGEKENLNSTSYNINEDKYGNSDKETEDVLDSIKNGLPKRRIQISENSSDSEAPETHEATTEQKIRLNNKRIKMKQKFKGLLSSRNKSATATNEVGSGNESDNSSSGTSESETTSISNKIKQKIKKSMTSIPSICDPDTSDEENTSNKIAPKQRQKKPQKSIKMTDAKPIKMSAKLAMENMQLIKSESNRLIREKDVSLPYHRPKALSLKDVLSKRKPAISSDGKILPIKMNDEQLKEYALQLEQRQKEMMELCKSESDEENSEDVILNAKDENMEIQSKIDNLSSNEEQAGDLFQNVEITEISKSENGLENILLNEVHMPKITTDEHQNRNESINSINSQNNSNTDMRLVYNDSLEEENILLDNNPNDTNAIIVTEIKEIEAQRQILETYSEQESQSLHLNYTDTNTERSKHIINSEEMVNPDTTEQMDTMNNREDDFLSDDDINMEDIDKIIENSVIMKDEENEVSALKTSITSLNMKPKLIGTPGMVINLDDDEPIPKRSGMELLKEKFAYFSKLKTPDELEREREKKLKPGAQHSKLKQELEDKIAEQRSLEWAKRLEDEKQHHEELDAILDDVDNDDDNNDDTTEKVQSALKEPGFEQESNSESEEELVEDDIEITDKAHKQNPMIDDEAEESDIDENEHESDLKEVEPNEEDIEDDEGCVEEDNEDSSDSSESSESEDENQTSKARKGRILKAFEDSDDEDTQSKQKSEIIENSTNENGIEVVDRNSKEINNTELNDKCCNVPDPLEDDVIQLAQKHGSVSEDLFTSQETCTPNESDKFGDERHDENLTQTFSISCANKPNEFLCPSQPYDDPTIKVIAEGFTPNLLGSQMPVTQSSQSQLIGEDILALCTGKFYDNEFISQSHESEVSSQDLIGDNFINSNNIDRVEATINIKEDIVRASIHDNTNVLNNEHPSNNDKSDEISDKKNNDGGHILKSILDELDDPEFDKPIPNKFFTGGSNKNDVVDSSQLKKRLIIDSDDEINDSSVVTEKRKKKLKKKKLEARALHISDDEEEEDGELELDEEYDSDIEKDTERIVEYDSEENEIEVKPDKLKKKRPTTDFFEQEAELTSEDEWVGSGDEDEHGLDRMEREEGDDEVFHQGKLRKELGQIHMRDVLDQDKREVRLLQELLFEDGDLGGGHRQRKFRWRNADDEEAGTIPGEFADTQEEFEFESEEQWRKQRHEREVFLRQMQNQDDDDGKVNVTVDRTSIIKANLSSKSMSTLLMEVNQSKIETISTPAAPEKKSTKDVPSPKKSFSILQQNYHGSLLTRGRGALARLAALVTPLAVDDDAPKISSLAPNKRNFVFATVTPDDKTPKVTIKRKADVSTPKLVKKMRIEEKQNNSKSSLLDHFNL